MTRERARKTRSACHDDEDHCDDCNTATWGPPSDMGVKLRGGRAMPIVLMLGSTVLLVSVT